MNASTSPDLPPVYVVSGGTGASGEQLTHTVLAQFPGQVVPVITLSHVRERNQIEDVVAQARSTGGTIVHTLVDVRLRTTLMSLALKQGVVAIDLVGGLQSQLAAVLRCEPLGQPGLYRRLNRDYFERISAIEFTLSHDDGIDPEGWPQADLVLAGVSRTGKTPLSIYLSVLGWKVANVPIVLGLPAPPELLQLDVHRTIGLTINLDRLLALRQQRYLRMGRQAPADYINPEFIEAEIQMAEKLYRQHGFTILNVTNKPIESTADEIIRRITVR